MRYFRVITIILLISWMALIFSLSAENATESSKTSGGIIATVIEIFSSKFSELNILDQQEIIESFQSVVRKAAHFSIYVVLGFLSFLVVSSYEKILLKYKILGGISFCVLYAITDEIHQLFVVGRSCELRDIVIDSCGAVLGVLVSWLILRSKLFRKFFKAVIL